MFYLMGKIHLVNLLNRLDRMTMAAGVEARVPFLDHDLVEFVSRIPVHHKLRWNGLFSRLKAVRSNSEKISEKYDTTKFILRLMAEGKIPKTIIRRKKMGFPVPLDIWLDDKMKREAWELLTDSQSRTKDFYNKKNLERFLSRNDELKSQESFQAAYDYDGKKIWMLMNVELWCRRAFG